jgi:hypothetical protein
VGVEALIAHGAAPATTAAAIAAHCAAGEHFEAAGVTKNGWAIMRGGAEGPITTPNLFVRLKGASPPTRVATRRSPTGRASRAISTTTPRRRGCCRRVTNSSRARRTSAPAHPSDSTAASRSCSAASAWRASRPTSSRPVGSTRPAARPTPSPGRRSGCQPRGRTRTSLVAVAAPRRLRIPPALCARADIRPGTRQTEEAVDRASIPLPVRHLSRTLAHPSVPAELGLAGRCGRARLT